MQDHSRGTNTYTHFVCCECGERSCISHTYHMDEYMLLLPKRFYCRIEAFFQLCSAITIVIVSLEIIDDTVLIQIRSLWMFHMHAKHMSACSTRSDPHNCIRKHIDTIDGRFRDCLNFRLSVLPSFFQSTEQMVDSVHHFFLNSRGQF